MASATVDAQSAAPTHQQTSEFSILPGASIASTIVSGFENGDPPLYDNVGDLGPVQNGSPEIHKCNAPGYWTDSAPSPHLRPGYDGHSQPPPPAGDLHSTDEPHVVSVEDLLPVRGSHAVPYRPSESPSHVVLMDAAFDASGMPEARPVVLSVDTPPSVHLAASARPASDPASVAHTPSLHRGRPSSTATSVPLSARVLDPDDAESVGSTEPSTDASLASLPAYAPVDSAAHGEHDRSTTLCAVGQPAPGAALGAGVDTATPGSPPAVDPTTDPQDDADDDDNPAVQLLRDASAWGATLRRAAEVAVGDGDHGGCRVGAATGGDHASAIPRRAQSSADAPGSIVTAPRVAADGEAAAGAPSTPQPRPAAHRALDGTPLPDALDCGARVMATMKAAEAAKAAALAAREAARCEMTAYGDAFATRLRLEAEAQACLREEKEEQQAAARAARSAAGATVAAKVAKGGPAAAVAAEPAGAAMAPHAPPTVPRQGSGSGRDAPRVIRATGPTTPKGARPALALPHADGAAAHAQSPATRAAWRPAGHGAPTVFLSPTRSRSGSGLASRASRRGSSASRHTPMCSMGSPAVSFALPRGASLLSVSAPRTRSASAASLVPAAPPLQRQARIPRPCASPPRDAHRARSGKPVATPAAPAAAIPTHAAPAADGIGSANATNAAEYASGAARRADGRDKVNRGATGGAQGISVAPPPYVCYVPKRRSARKRSSPAADTGSHSRDASRGSAPVHTEPFAVAAAAVAAAKASIDAAIAASDGRAIDLSDIRFTGAEVYARARRSAQAAHETAGPGPHSVPGALARGADGGAAGGTAMDHPTTRSRGQPSSKKPSSRTRHAEPSKAADGGGERYEGGAASTDAVVAGDGVRPRRRRGQKRVRTLRRARARSSRSASSYSIGTESGSSSSSSVASMSVTTAAAANAAKPTDPPMVDAAAAPRDALPPAMTVPSLSPSRVRPIWDIPSPAAVREEPPPTAPSTSATLVRLASTYGAPHQRTMPMARSASRTPSYFTDVPYVPDGADAPPPTYSRGVEDIAAHAGDALALPRRLLVAAGIVSPHSAVPDGFGHSVPRGTAEDGLPRYGAAVSTAARAPTGSPHAALQPRLVPRSRSVLSAAGAAAAAGGRLRSPVFELLDPPPPPPPHYDALAPPGSVIWSSGPRDGAYAPDGFVPSWPAAVCPAPALVPTRPRSLSCQPLIAARAPARASVPRGSLSPRAAAPRVEQAVPPRVAGATSRPRVAPSERDTRPSSATPTGQAAPPGGAADAAAQRRIAAAARRSLTASTARDGSSSGALSHDWAARAAPHPHGSAAGDAAVMGWGRAASPTPFSPPHRGATTVGSSSASHGTVSPTVVHVHRSYTLGTPPPPATRPLDARRGGECQMRTPPQTPVAAVYGRDSSRASPSPYALGGQGNGLALAPAHSVQHGRRGTERAGHRVW